jgi:calcium-dependent protein kinase
MLQDDKLQAAFKVYDKDDSGSISTDEIKDIIGVGKKIPKNIWDEVVQEVDANGDGEVSFDEFKTMMRKLLQ